MPGEKTEKPTQKKIKDSRREGRVFRSNDITQAILFLTALGALAAGGGFYFTLLKDVMSESFRPEFLTGTLRPDQVLQRIGAAWGRPIVLLLPLLASLFLMSGLSMLLQVRPLFAPKAIQPKLEKLNPLKGLQNIFLKPRTYLELVKNILKFAIVLGVAFYVIKGSVRDIILTAGTDLRTAGAFASDLLFRLLFRVAGAFLVIGAADFLLQKRLYMKELMMSKDEVKKEYKEQEGDPFVKGQRRQLHEQILAWAMAEKVPVADAVVVNPTHLAVAIEYKQRTMTAPAVTAKGQDDVAQTIIEIAKQHRVPIVRNIPLARGLFAVDVGQEIPEELYEPVAEVLNWVMLLAQSGEEQMQEAL